MLAVYLTMAVPVFPELWTAVSSPDIVGPLLVLTILLSPFGLLLFLVLRAARSRRTRPGSERPGRAGSVAAGR